MRVCITGGAGFIGQALARILVGEGSEVVGIDSLNPQVHVNPRSSYDQFPGFLLVEDIRSRKAVSEVVAGSDVVVHLAAETGVGQSMTDAQHYRSVNGEGTRVVVEELRRAGTSLLLISSRAVYGQGAYFCSVHGRSDLGRCCAQGIPDRSLESDRYLPLSVYGESKVEAELLALEAYSLAPGQLMVMRPQNVIGPGQAPHNPYTGVLAAFAARIAAGLGPQIYGSGEQTRDFIDIEDTARILAWATNALFAAQFDENLLLNVGTGRRVSIGDLAGVALQNRNGGGCTIEYIDVVRSGDVDHACADVNRLGALGAPVPKVSLIDSVQGFLRYAASMDRVDPVIWDRALLELDSPHSDRSE